ncbi:lysylphosphatidylglycerol synthase transmembrane domain-containing protein [Phaeospirillum tilakii]|uniref:Lysylphosphatidylglycerol synthase transmembrane domain-containing protein n=1 Tax=Phaeospirillum tilakii TaxID=741673 RepID=A0ABW5CCH6_9PROT
MKRWLPWLLKGALSAGLIWFVFRKVDLASAWSQAKTLDPLMLVLALALALFQVWLGAVRWWLVLRALKASFTATQALVVYYIGVFFSIVLPGAIGGDAVRMWQARRSGLSLAASVNSVMLERAATVLGLVLLVAATQPLLLARVPTIPGSWVFPLLSALGVVGILVLSLLDRLPDSLNHLRLVRGLMHLASDTRALFFRPVWGGSTLAVAIFGHVNLALQVYVLAVGLGLDISVVDCLVLVPPVILIMTLPISIAGWGVRETAMVAAFGYIGTEPHSALVLSVLFGLTCTAGALPGGLVWLLSGVRAQVREGEQG